MKYFLIILLFWPILIFIGPVASLLGVSALLTGIDALVSPDKFKKSQETYVPYYLDSPECTIEKIREKEAQAEAEGANTKIFIPVACKLMAESDESHGFRPPTKENK